MRIIKRGRSVDFDKLKKVLQSIIYEQATCEFSGTKWGEKMLKDLDEALTTKKV